jgi:hypothetical protein
VTHPFLIGARPPQRGPHLAARVPMDHDDAIALSVPDGVDELMIRWGNLPRASDVHVYLPAVAADDVLHEAALLMDDPGLEKVDDHTIRLRSADVSFVPIPRAAHAGPLPGLLRIVTPDDVRVEQQFRVVLHHFSRPTRRIVGTFQLTIPVDLGTRLREPETRLLSVMRHIFGKLPRESGWYPVLSRYLDSLAGRVRGFGGDPDLVEPSPDGGESPAEWTWNHSLNGRLCNWLRRVLRACCLRFKRCLARHCGPPRP